MKIRTAGVGGDLNSLTLSVSPAAVYTDQQDEAGKADIRCDFNDHFNGGVEFVANQVDGQMFTDAENVCGAEHDHP